MRTLALDQVSRTRPIAYLQLRATAEAAAFSWEADPRSVPGPKALLARGVTNGIMAEAVVERFGRQQPARLQALYASCPTASCSAWGLEAAEAQNAMCCEAVQHEGDQP